MSNLYDVFQSAQNGEAVDALARQFQLSSQQAEAAVEALLPAFSFGLKRQAAQAATAPNLFAMIGGGMPPFRQASAAPAAAPLSGETMVAALFGSSEAARAVAQQAAAVSGLGAGVLNAMMPVMAAMLIDGFARTLSAQPQVQDLWQRWLASVTPPAAGGATQPPSPAPNQDGSGLFGALLDSMLPPGAQPAKPAAAAPPPDPPPPPPPDAVEAKDLVGQLFETGRQIQETQIQALQSIFDAYLGPPAGASRKPG